MSAAGAALFGPVGAAVAGTVALIGMKQLYKVFTNAREDLSLAEGSSYMLKHLVDLAILDDKLTEKAIVSLAHGLNVKFKYDTLDEFEAFMLSDDVLEL